MMTKIEGEKEKPKPGGRGGGGGGSTSTSISTSPPGSGGPDDRISELPKEILQHILGFLEMDELLIETSLVSTRWRNLWKSVSTLNFPNCMISRRRRTDDDSDDDSVVVDNGGGGGGGIRNNVEKYQNFVGHVLRLRDAEASKIHIFRYRCNDLRGGVSGYEDYLERLHNFIVSAVVNQGAQEIQVKGAIHASQKDNRIIHFNPSIFTSGGLLRRFTFAVGTTNFLIQFPRSMCCATQLTHLNLWGIRLPEGDDSNAQLHLVCPLLVTLFISNCISEHLKVFDISAPRLNTLFICNIDCSRFFGGSDFLGGCKIEIRSPNLTTLFYSGRVYVDCFTENLPRIASANLLIFKEPGMVVEQTSSFAIKLIKGLTTTESLTLGGPRIASANLLIFKEPGMVVEQTTSFAIKLLKGLTTTESLTLGGFEVFSQDTLKVLLSPFTSLRTLELKCNCKVSASIHVMVHILHICNSVEKFVWDVNEFVEVEGDEDLMLPQCRLSHLKHVHIKRLRGHENEIEFVKFLVKSSVVLEDIVINNTIKNSSKRLIFEEKLKQFIGEELSLRSIKLHIL